MTTAEEVSAYLFYGSQDSTIYLEASSENNNYYEESTYIWSCVPVDPDSCPYCPSEGCFILDIFCFSRKLNLFLRQIILKESCIILLDLTQVSPLNFQSHFPTVSFSLCFFISSPLFSSPPSP